MIYIELFKFWEMAQKDVNALMKKNYKWLITYDDSDYIRELFDFAQITNWNLTYGMRNIAGNSNQKARELFISNYDINSVGIQQGSLFDY